MRDTDSNKYKEVSFKYQNSAIRIAFGDLFALKGIKGIPVSRHFFETEIAESSLQYKIIQGFIQRYGFEGGIKQYKEKVLAALKNEVYIEDNNRTNYLTNRLYPLGTTALIELDGNQFLLFAITKTELKGSIPLDNCSVVNLWITLERFWHEVRQYAVGEAVNIPLIGSGITGINLKDAYLLELNVLAILNFLSEGKTITSEEIRIILHSKYMNEIDLSAFKKIWR